MRWLKGKTEVVAPISAPILQIVPIPVQEIESTPGPKYSTMAPVPPLTVNIPATFKITSLGEVQPDNLPENGKKNGKTKTNSVPYFKTT